MNWDAFIEKMNQISKETDSNICHLLCDQFGSWHDLAFSILKMELYDKVKYNGISFDCGDTNAGHKMIEAQALNRELTEFEEKYKEKVHGIK